MRTKPTNTIHLQGLGRVPAIRADEIEAGDILRWNHGAESAVLREVRETRCYRTFVVRSPAGRLNKIRLKKSRLVGVVPYAESCTGSHEPIETEHGPQAPACLRTGGACARRSA